MDINLLVAAHLRKPIRHRDDSWAEPTVENKSPIVVARHGARMLVLAAASVAVALSGWIALPISNG